jgi:hypothetical protein
VGDGPKFQCHENGGLRLLSLAALATLFVSGTTGIVHTHEY